MRKGRQAIIEAFKDKQHAFLEQNADEDGVKTTESGLQYKILQEGQGRKPGATSRVTVHYEGKLVSGKVFDSSYARGETIQFGLN